MLAVVVFALVGSVSAQGLGLVGGFSDITDLDRKDLLDLAWKAAPTVNKHASITGPNALVPLTILKARSQVVAGTLYELDISFGGSACLKGVQVLSAANCPTIPSGFFPIYRVKIVNKIDNTTEVLSVEKI